MLWGVNRVSVTRNIYYWGGLTGGSGHYYWGGLTPPGYDCGGLTGVSLGRPIATTAWGVNPPQSII